METQSHKITVNVLTTPDLEWFVEEAAIRMLREEVLRPDLVNLHQLYKLANKGMDQGTAFVAKSGDIPVGALGAILINNLYNPELQSLVELFWYVLPEYRKGRAGLMLLKEFDRVASDLADEATLSLLGSSEIRTGSLEKRGFNLGEFAFIKRYR